MKRIVSFTSRMFFAAAVCLMTSVASAQTAAPSPAAKDSAVLGGKVFSVSYSSPAVKGRDIFGADGLLSKEKNYPVWRAGANAATVFHTDADLMIGNLRIPKGDYTLFVNIANPQAWELIINKQTGQSGLAYQPGMDLGRVKMTMAKVDPPQERLSYKLTLPKAQTVKLRLAWDKTEGSVEFAVK